jgi:3-methyladenine DNA glycosylase AlkC
MAVVQNVGPVRILGLRSASRRAIPVLPNWFTAFLAMLMEAWSARRDAHIRFLKLQVEVLRSRLPANRLICPLEERAMEA